MSTTTQKKLIDEILGDDFTKQMLRELGVENSSHAVQEEILAKLTTNVVERVMLEILTALPESERPEFESLVGSGDTQRFREFLEKNIEDVDGFIQSEVTKEYERTKTRIHMIEQGV